MADATLKAKNRDVIIGLEISPFLNDGNGDGASAPYSVESVVVEDGRCHATLGRAMLESEVRPELTKTRSSWIFVNFHYSFFSEDGTRKKSPDNDLVHMLNR